MSVVEKPLENFNGHFLHCFCIYCIMKTIPWNNQREKWEVKTQEVFSPNFTCLHHSSGPVQ